MKLAAIALSLVWLCTSCVYEKNELKVMTQNIQGELNQRKYISITDYGAVGDGVANNTPAIQQAVDDCHKAGGGRVIIPEGKFLSGTIILKDHVELYLAKDAILLASTNHVDFPTFNPEYRSHKDINGFHSLIYAEKATDIAITGQGTIDGQGKQQRPRQGKQYQSDRDGRCRNILLISCKKIQIDGITIRNSGTWNQHYLNCENVTVDQITVHNHSNRNNDGIDIDGCRKFKLTNSIFDSDDDAICLKSTGPAACENVLVSNCVASSHCNAIKTGTESTGGFKNIIITDCSVKPSANKHIVFGRKEGITGITIGCVDGGDCTNITINNITIEGTLVPIFVRLGKRNRSHTDGAKVTKDSTMHDITIRNITAKNCGDWGCAILGLPDNPIENLELSNIRITFPGGGTKEDSARIIEEKLSGYPQPTTWGKLPAYGFFIRNTRNVTMKDIELKTKKPDAREPVVLK